LFLLRGDATGELEVVQLRREFIESHWIVRES